jgi:hypothetical protein
MWQKAWSQDPIRAYNNKESKLDGLWHQMLCDSGIGALHKEELCKVYPQVT